MGNNHYDVIVIGLGGMGAGALYQAAKRGANVLGIDRFTPPHTNGSSHGETRITRQAVGEGEMYVPFVMRSNEIWRELESLTGEKLYITSGGLIIAPADGGAEWHHDGDFVTTTANIAKNHNIEHSVLNAEDTMQQHPLLKMRSKDHAYYEPEAGVVRPELCIQTQLDQAQKHGATLHTNEQVTGYEAHVDHVTVTTEAGTYTADSIILSAGAWMPDFMPSDYKPNLSVYRQVIYWFETEGIEQFTEENFPFLLWIGDKKADFFSAFPTPRDGIQGLKVLTEEYIETTTADHVDRDIKPEEVAQMVKMTQDHLHGVTDKLMHADVCMYTHTTDDDFIIDFHPDSKRVVIASPCSGHGFKHSAAIGEALAEMALQGKSTLDINHFSLSRFTTKEQ